MPYATWTYRGRWALVTGASAGIGEAFARALAQRGMNVVVSARRAERLEALAASLRQAHGVEAVAVAADLAADGAAAELWARAASGRTIDLLVNNAGFGAKGAFADVAAARQAEMVTVNCTAPLELLHLAARDMGGRSAGAVVNVASIAAFQPIPLLATYAATKAFLLTLSEGVAAELEPRGVRVLALCPGPVATEFQAVAGTSVSARTPGLLDAERVVEDTLRALERGAHVVVPGALNRVGTVAARVLPRSWIVGAAKTVIKRFR